MLKHILFCGVSGMASLLVAAERIEPEVGGWGWLQAIRLDGQRFAVRTGMNVAAPQWRKVVGSDTWTVKETKLTREGAARIGAGRIPFGDSYIAYRQTVTPDQHGVRVHLEATPQSSIPAEGMGLTVAIPLRDFAGGEARLLNAQPAMTAAAVMPEQKRVDRHVLRGLAAGVEIRKGDRKLTVRFDRPRSVTLQDDREFNSEQYTLWAPIQIGNLVAGETTTAEMLITAELPIDHGPVTLKVQDEEAAPLNGFGGNFVYDVASPVSRYNLDHLNVAMARVGMPLNEWEPQNDNADPALPDMQRLSANDKPGTSLRTSLEFARELSGRKIPFTATCSWPLPRWLESAPEQRNTDKDRSVVPRQSWDELAESVGSYLLYARDKYGAEPAMFAFNEPDINAQLKLTPEEHRDLVILLGQRFQQLGLKTRLLGGDLAHPDSVTYIAPLIASPEAMQYVQAIAFHTWGEATPEHYAQWHQASVRTGKPLLVTEAGVDAQAWCFPDTFGEYYYGVSEARQYIELLQHARPQAILLWEYTTDYGIVGVDATSTPARVVPTKRYHFIRQLAALTPRNGAIQETSSSRDDVLFAAIKGTSGSMALHVLNDGPARQARIAGASGPFAVYVTDQARDMQAVGEVSSEIELPAWSLVTLVKK